MPQRLIVWMALSPILLRPRCDAARLIPHWGKGAVASAPVSQSCWTGLVMVFRQGLDLVLGPCRCGMHIAFGIAHEAKLVGGQGHGF
ncbi:MAG: hypothetical protein RLZZ563_1857 [Pseudomonadota bacterium]